MTVNFRLKDKIVCISSGESYGTVVTRDLNRFLKIFKNKPSLINTNGFKAWHSSQALYSCYCATKYHQICNHPGWL